MNKPPPTIADLVNLLFETIRRPDGRTYTEKEVSEHVNITQKTLNHIRTGRTPNPGISAIREISHFFGVSLDFFDVERLDDCYAFLNERKGQAERSPSVEGILLRAVNLSDEAQQDVLRVISWVEAMERERRASAKDQS